MSISTPEELAALRKAGRVAALVLRTASAAVRPGITTAELDRVADAEMRRWGARSAPNLVYGFPGSICISVDDEAVHGIPGPRRLHAGQLVKVDVTVEVDGFFADTAATVEVGAVPARSAKLRQAAEAALRRALATARAGTPLREVGRTIENEVARRGFSVLPALYGHGIGRTIHESPDVPQSWVPGLRTALREGLVITIEPIISAGSRYIREKDDGWTIVTADGSPSAHAEHTVVIGRGAPLILTQA
jgi:methionyl aminopeptidase